MTSSSADAPAHEPDPQPAPTLDSVVAALVEGRSELSDEQCRVLSDLGPPDAARFRDALAGLDAPARFVLLSRLVERERAGRLLDFSSLYLATLHDDDPGVRALVVAGLGTCEQPAMIPALLDAAQADPDETVRAEACIALGPFALRAELGTLRPRDAEAVIDGLRGIAADVGEDPAVQAAAIAGLGVLTQPWVTDMIYDAYESAEPAIRVGALQAMGRTADDYWLPTLVNAMESPDSDERYSAARAAGEIASEDAVIPLAALLDDDALDVVEAAAAALGEIGGPVAGEQLEGYDSHPDPAVRAAVQAGLRAAAFDGDPLGLGAMSDPNAPSLVGPERGPARPPDD